MFDTHEVKKIEPQLAGCLYRETEGTKKDWFGYLNIPEAELKAFAELIRDAPRIANPDGSKIVRVKLLGWNRNSKGKSWIKFIFGRQFHAVTNS